MANQARPAMDSFTSITSLAVLITILSVYSSSALPQLSSSVSTSSSTSRCVPVEVAKCSTFYTSAQMPNMFGEYSQTKSSETLRDILSKLGSTNKLVISFLCSIYTPPCPLVSKGTDKVLQSSLPCRGTCEEALRESRGSLTIDQSGQWPVRCHTLPNHNCFAFDGISSLRFRETYTSVAKRRPQAGEVARFAPLEVELGSDGVDEPDNDDEFKVEIVSLTSGQIPARRYDIADLGDPTLFQGWVDVQGTGAANDYCRVVGRGKRRFMSCNLAGSSGQGHHYVSKLGFDPGHAGTWFMRDMDGDSRDDYCRCVGSSSKSHVTCMKAGERGFYGSSTQGGDEHSFRLPQSAHCVDRLVNQAFGE